MLLSRGNLSNWSTRLFTRNNATMEIPKRTAEIFEVLSKGAFICSNSATERTRQLYAIIDEPDNYAALQGYFAAINFVLEKGNEYYYFSRNENKQSIERKLDAAYHWIDVVDFFKAYDMAFGVGYSFTVSDVAVKVQVDVNLRNKLEQLRKSKEDSYSDSIQKLVKSLCEDTFADLESEILKSYKILSSFHYLEDLIQNIQIPDEVQDEIPE